MICQQSKAQLVDVLASYAVLLSKKNMESFTRFSQLITYKWALVKKGSVFTVFPVYYSLSVNRSDSYNKDIQVIT